MWRTFNLTTAAPNSGHAFNGRGSIYAEGTFGGGAINIHLVAQNEQNGPKQTSTGAVRTIDGTNVSDADLPSGEYQISLVGSTGGDVTVYYNDQDENVVTS